MGKLPGDVIRILDWEELPASVREIPQDYDPLAEGVFMKHQAGWVKQIHEHPLNLCEKGRRTGITFATALDDAITASSQRSAGGDNCYYIGDTKEKGLEYIGYAAHMAKVMASAMAEGWQGIEVFLFEDQQRTSRPIAFATRRDFSRSPCHPDRRVFAVSKASLLLMKRRIILTSRP
jgi:hypothetical protein